MVDKLVLGFEIHQPFRIRRDAFWNPRYKGSLRDRFIDESRNREIFERVKDKSYIPTLKLLMALIEESENLGYNFKFFLSTSGTFIEQAEMWGKDVIELLQQLSYTHSVEFLGQTYYHSITSLWYDKSEWIDQVKEHKNLIRAYFGQDPVTFENTELIANNEIAKLVENLGFKTFIIEGTKNINPNLVYKLKNSNLTIIPRNFILSDDIAFRFSNVKWDQYPLTADKYATWIKSSPGQMVLVFIDFETFGEHQSKESGIFEFLRWLPRELQQRGILTKTPKELIKEAYQEIELKETTSWADISKSQKSWLGNQMQYAYDEAIRRCEILAKESGGEYLKVWKYFTTSDNYYYLYMGKESEMEVHSYFNQFNSPLEAFINEFFAVISYCENLITHLNISNDPFFFTKDGYHEITVWTKDQFNKVIKEHPEFKNLEIYLKDWLK